MPLVVDDLLYVFAAEAGKAAGTEIAKGIIKFLTGKLATKQDLERAVNEIKNYIHQELLAIEAKAIVVDVDTAILALRQYETGGRLLVPNTQELLNKAHSEIGSAVQSNPRYLSTHYVAVVRFTAASTAFWAAVAFNLGRKNEVRNFIEAVLDAKGLLRSCLDAIHTQEDETISPLSVEEGHFSEPPSPDNPGARPYVNYRAQYYMARGRYAGGRITCQSKWDYRENHARREMEPSYAAETQRIAKESAEREKEIYAPLVNCIDSLDKLLLKVKGKEGEEALAILGAGLGQLPSPNACP